MKSHWLALFVVAFSIECFAAPPEAAAGFETNRSAVYLLATRDQTNITPNPRYGRTNQLDPNRFPPEVIERITKARLSEPKFLTNVATFTNRVFSGFAPGTLSAFVFDQITSRTNGRETLMWTRRQHTLMWPLTPPTVEWNPRSLIWGLKGIQAISPCWEKEGAPGQVPVTLITRRHGYARGHGMGKPGLVQTFSGRKVWFVTSEDRIVTAKVTSAFVRQEPGFDYTILMFAEDLPSSIPPLRVISQETLDKKCPTPYGVPSVLLCTEQGGNVSADLPGFKLPLMKGGDSGSPNLLLYKDELIFVGGRTTSAPSKRMQEDIDALCRKESAPSSRYQLDWLDLSSWPDS